MWEEFATDLDIWYGSSLDNDPPEIPSIDGPNKGDPGQEQEFTVSTVDPNVDDVFYFIDWGDGSDSGWIGPYSSGADVKEKHKWSGEESYTIRVKAKDTYESESDWAEFVYSTPKTKIKLLNLFEMLLNKFPILNKILGI